jgi:hypothetical protein
MQFPSLSRWRRGFALACFSLMVSTAHAQVLPGAAELGMTVQQLQQAVPLRAVPHPAHLAGGLAGSWSGPAIVLAGVALTPTFFFAEGQLRRIEYLAFPDADAQGYDALLAWGRAAWGPELASEGPEGTYATWSSDTLDAYLQRTGDAHRPQLRLVVKRHMGKDAGEL